MALGWGCVFWPINDKMLCFSSLLIIRAGLAIGQTGHFPGGPAYFVGRNGRKLDKYGVQYGFPSTDTVGRHWPKNADLPSQSSPAYN